MPNKEAVAGSCVSALLIFPLMLYAVADPWSELRGENQDNGTVSQSPSEVRMPSRQESRISECLQRYSCSNVWLRPIRGLKCNCDNLCELYDDCCHDFKRTSSVEGVLPSPELIDCVTLSNSREYKFSQEKGALVVTRCPVSYGNVFIREWCESSDDDFNSQPLNNLPVSGRKSKVLYRNWYCAFCNNELDVVFWRIKKEKLKRYQKVINSSSEDVRRSSDSGRLTNGSEVFEFDPDGFSPRECLNSVRKCAENWTNQETAMRCEQRLQVTAYVDGHETGQRNQRTYRNPDCATCNYAEESSISCSLEIKKQDTGRPGPTFPISFLFISNSITKTVDVPQKCERGMVYDPSAKLCLEILCAERSKRGNDSRCTTINGREGLLTFSESLNCTKFVRPKASEFTFYNNQSLLVHKNRSSYAITDYVIDSDYIYICLSYVQVVYNETVRHVISFQFDRIQGILSLVGSTISLTSLFVLFVVYLIFPVLRNVPGKCVMCLVVSLFSALLLFLFVSSPGPFCFYLSAAIHFAFLASFCWMNVLSIDICRTFAYRTISSESRSTSKHFVFYSIYSWTLPAAITFICLILDIAQVDDRIRPHYGREICWITNPTALIVFFLVPVALLLTANFVLFGITACALRRYADDSRMAAKKSTSHKARLLLHAKLSIIMGLPWVLGYAANLTQWTVLWYLFIIFNAMQGTFLCLSFVCTKRVFRLMRDCSPWGLSSISARNENKHGRTQTDSVELSSCVDQDAVKRF